MYPIFFLISIFFAALDTIFQTQQEKYKGRLVLKYNEDLDINCMIDLNESTRLIATESGLFGNHNESLVQITGPLHVYELLVLPAANLVLMIVDTDRLVC